MESSNFSQLLLSSTNVDAEPASDWPLLTKLGQYWSNFEQKFHGGSTQGSIFTLCISTIGPGMLFLPYSISESGLVWGILQLMFCAFLAFFSLNIIVRCAIKAKVCSYQELAEITYGKKFRWLINIVFFIGSVGTTLLHLKIVSALISALISPFYTDNQPSTWILNTILITIGAFVLIPLSLPRTLKQLRYLWILSFFSVLFFCYVILQEAFTYQSITHVHGNIKYFIWTGASETFPAVVYAFMCHFSVLDVFGELNVPTQKRMKKIITHTTIWVLICYIIVGVMGYLTFADGLDSPKNIAQAGGIVLLAFMYTPEGDAQPLPTLVIVCVIIMTVMITVKCPLYIKPGKDSLRDFFIPNKSDKNGEPICPKEPRILHFCLIVVTISVAVVAAIFPQDAIVIINIVGSTVFLLVCFIFPCMFYLKLFPRRGIMVRIRRILSWIILIGLLAFGIWNTYKNIYHVV